VRINTNVMALNAQNMLMKNQSNVELSIQKLSSGLRINGAADDASGLAISEKMRAQIRGLNQAESNAYDGISMIQTAEGALQQTTDILQRMRELVVKSQNSGVLTDTDKTSITTELSSLVDEMDRIASSTTFNSKKLLDGTLESAGAVFKIGFPTDSHQTTCKITRNGAFAAYGAVYQQTSLLQRRCNGTGIAHGRAGDGAAVHGQIFHRAAVDNAKKTKYRIRLKAGAALQTGNRISFSIKRTSKRISGVTLAGAYSAANRRPLTRQFDAA